MPLARRRAHALEKSKSRARQYRPRKGEIGDFQSRRFPLALAADPICHAKGAITCMAASARQSGQSLAGQGGAYSGHQISYQRQCDMVDIHIQPHTNRICGNQEINIAILIHLNLFVARAW